MAARSRSAVRQAGAGAAGGADGDVSLVLMLDLETEVEMKLPGRFKVSPQIAGALRRSPAWWTYRRCEAADSGACRIRFRLD